MTAHAAHLPGRPVELDAPTQRSLSFVRADAYAVLLYGSRARGTSRPDSDVDILALVDNQPGSFQQGLTSITYYTLKHLRKLARNGSLFVRHIRDEGIVLADPDQALKEVFASYQRPHNSANLRRELAAVLGSLSTADCHHYHAGLGRAGAWAARTAIYLALEDDERLTFDIEAACGLLKLPKLSKAIHAAREGSADLSSLMRMGQQVLHDIEPAEDASSLTLADYVILLWDSFEVAPRLLESVVAGHSMLSYTELTLPPG